LQTTIGKGALPQLGSERSAISPHAAEKVIAFGKGIQTPIRVPITPIR